MLKTCFSLEGRNEAIDLHAEHHFQLVMTAQNLSSFYFNWKEIQTNKSKSNSSNLSKKT